MLKKIINFSNNYYQVFLISIALWCILNESIGLITLFESLIVGFITSLSIDRLLGKDNHYANHQNFSLLVMLKYYVVLFISIYKSTFSIIRIIFFENPVPRFVRYKSHTQNEWARCLISNSITLTPGTVAVDDKYDEMTVLWIKPTTKNKDEYCEIIQGDFEKVLN